MQFRAICYHLLTSSQKGANFLVTGAWSNAVAKEASKWCKLHIVEDTKAIGHSTVRESTWSVLQNADFFHYVDNETADGFEFNQFPYHKVPAGQPLICDMSSSLLTKPIDWSKYGVVYASAQK